MQYQIASVNWPRQLAEAIASAQDGDTIIVASEAAKDLAERAKLRMCPDKQITFEVHRLTLIFQEEYREH